MQEIKILHDQGQSAELGTRLFINGVELPNLQCVSLEHPAGKPATVTAAIYAKEKFECVLPADVKIEVTALPGWSVHVKRYVDGTVKYNVVENRGEVNE